MIYTLQRYFSNGDSTQGILIGNNKMYHSLEDEGRVKKLKKETRIPSGTYLLKIRKEDTPLTIKHRITYGSWFKYHIEISGIKDFSGVYVHAGNNDDHTDGCLLLGDQALNSSVVKGNILISSISAIKRFYEDTYPLIEKGEKVYLIIQDESAIIGKR